MRWALFVLVVLTALPVKAAEPISLRVIPYKAGWGSKRIPVHSFQGTLQVPPPLVTEVPTVERMSKKRRRKSGRSRDLDWLMD